MLIHFRAPINKAINQILNEVINKEMTENGKD